MDGVEEPTVPPMACARRIYAPAPNEAERSRMEPNGTEWDRADSLVQCVLVFIDCCHIFREILCVSSAVESVCFSFSRCSWNFGVE